MISVQSSPSSSLFSCLTFAGFPTIREAVAALWAVMGTTAALWTFAGGSSAGGMDRLRSVMIDSLGIGKGLVITIAEGWWTLASICACVSCVLVRIWAGLGVSFMMGECWLGCNFSCRLYFFEGI